MVWIDQHHVDSHYTEYSLKDMLGCTNLDKSLKTNSKLKT